jgi:DNA helicase HerA-like ATPase
MKGLDHLIYYFEQKDSEGQFLFLSDDFHMPAYDASNKFDFNKLEDALDIAILYEEAHGNRQIRDYCSSLITRYKSLRERKDFHFLTGDTGDLDKEKFVNDILGIATEIDKKTQLSIIDLNTVDDEIIEVISCVISRMLFERLKQMAKRNIFPVNIILEEAHRYLSNDRGKVFGDANRIFERIAKEGRKYGMFLLVSSQRPSELSRTVLSQCSNFIVHRIQNPEDLLQIRQMTPHISTSILSRLPSIPRQHALVFGHSVQIPTLFKVNDANPTPHSHDNDISKNWFRPKDSTAKSDDDDFPF